MAEERTDDRDERLKALRDTLQKRSPDSRGIGCYMCRLILEDLDDGGRLNGVLPDFHNHPDFPRKGELAHLKLEGIPFQEGDL